MNEDRFATAIGVLGEAFRQKITAVTIKAYRMGLDGLSIEGVESAIRSAIKRCRFMPVPAELRELAGELSPQDRAVKAWAAVTHALDRFDYYKSVAFDDPVTTATVRHLWQNWMGFCEAFGDEKEVWLRKEFERVYCSLFRSGVSREAARPLIGAFERENLRSGYGQPASQHVVKITCGLPPVPMLGHEPRRAMPAAEVKLLETTLEVAP